MINNSMMETIIGFLIVLMVLPIIILLGMWLLEVTSDILFLIVRLLDKITGNKTEKRLERDEDNGYR